MATKQKDSVPGKEKRTGPSPMGGTSTHTERRRLRPSTPPGMKDPGKAPVPATSSTARPNYLKPTVSSKPEAGRHLVKKHEHDDINHHKPSPRMARRISFDRPIPPSQVHKAAVHSYSTAHGERKAAAASTPLKSSGTRPVASSERVSKVVKAVKAQPPLVKVKSLPKLSSISKVRKEVKTTGLKRAEEEPFHAPCGTESEAEEQETLDLNVEEELAKMESHVDLPPDKLLAEEDKEHFDEKHLRPTKHVDADEEKQVSDDIKISEDHQDEGLVADKNTESVEEANDEKQADESEQESNQPPLNEAPPADGTKNDEKEADTEEIKPVGLTVKTTPDESGQVVENESQGWHSAEEKPANAEAENVVHKRQVGGPRSKKESPAYNDVIEETASKLVEKRVNKVRALAGAFETVISLQQPDSS